MTNHKYIAVDLGAESGRVMLGSVTDFRLPNADCRFTISTGHLTAENRKSQIPNTITLEEIHRFNNGPIEENGSLHWDFNRLLSEIKTGISAAVKTAGAQVQGIGIDSWGVDFGLLDAAGKLVENPYHYRDSRTNGVMEKAFELMSKREIYENTGLQFMQLNSVYQLLAMRLANSAALAKAKNLLFMANLFSYYLSGYGPSGDECGEVFAEYTLASTSQFMDMKSGQWSKEVLARLSLPIDIMPKIVQPGTVVGQYRLKIDDCPLPIERDKSKIANRKSEIEIPVIAIGSHDTASAVAAVPAAENGNGSTSSPSRAESRDWAFLSSGTWSVMGVEVPKAIVNDKTFEYEFTNEGGVENTIRLLRNIVGLWLIQECKRQWQREGIELSYPELSAMAEKARPFAGYIDVDNSAFLAPGDMPKRVNEYLTKTGQKTTGDKGQLIRIILESLAFKYRYVVEALEDITGKEIEVLHIVGGGIQNELLCQFAANATGKKVITGPVEATASGNILMQARATGQIKTLTELRKIVRNSFELKEYQPQEASLWEKQYKKARSKSAIRKADKSFRSP